MRNAPVVSRTLVLAALAAVLGLAPVPQADAAPAKPTEAAAAPRAGATLVDINAAGEDQLMGVPGIGPALAKKIVDFRKQNGPFQRVEDLMKVRGVGEKSFQKLRAYLTVGKK